MQTTNKTRKTRFNFFIEQDTLADLKALAGLQGSSVAQIINNLVDDYLKDNQDALSQLQTIRLK